MKALIICLISGEYTLYDKDTKETFIAKPRGVFRNNKTSPKVGDVVEYTKGDPHAIITKVYDRHNDFIRPSVANIDQVIIISAVKEPELSFLQLNRYISFARYHNLKTVYEYFAQ